jgi:hypothetical protein
MKPPAFIKSSRSLFLALLMLMPLTLLAAEGIGDKPATGLHETAPITEPAMPFVEHNGEDLQTLRQRYHRDATGVRARIGMCRRSHGKGGNGHGGGHGRWREEMRDRHPPCAKGEQRWSTP